MSSRTRGAAAPAPGPTRRPPARAQPVFQPSCWHRSLLLAHPRSRVAALLMWLDQCGPDLSARPLSFHHSPAPPSTPQTRRKELRRECRYIPQRGGPHEREVGGGESQPLRTLSFSEDRMGGGDGRWRGGGQRGPVCFPGLLLGRSHRRSPPCPFPQSPGRAPHSAGLEAGKWPAGGHAAAREAWVSDGLRPPQSVSPKQK